MNKTQVLTIAGFVLLLLVLLFGFNTKPQKLIKEERERSLNLQITDISIIRDEAMKTLSGDERSLIQILQSNVEGAESDSLKIEKLKELSSTWYELGNFALAGNYAEKIAEKTTKGESWGIAGTTYAIGITQSTQEKEKIYCREKALESLESAISLEPENVDYQLNRAVVLAEHPSSDNPMKGILILIDLNKKFPKNVPVINNLARFALQTNQLDKALERLNSALELDNDNIMTNCLMGQVYSKLGQMDKAEEYRLKCEQLK